MISIRRHLHKYPETSYDEFQSAEFIKEKLNELGIESTGGQGGTGVSAYLGNSVSGEGCVALRADMDALPIREQTGLGFSSVHEGVMHACGHDGHVAMLLGAAAILKKSSWSKAAFQSFQAAGPVALASAMVSRYNMASRSGLLILSAQRLISSSKSWLCNTMVDRDQAILPWGSPAEIAKLLTICERHSMLILRSSLAASRTAVSTSERFSTRMPLRPCASAIITKSGLSSGVAT